MTEDSVSRKYIYRALRNLLINEMGISKETVHKFVEEVIRKEVLSFLEHHVAESMWFRRLITKLCEDVFRNIATQKMNVMLKDTSTITFTVTPK